MRPPFFSTSNKKNVCLFIYLRGIDCGSGKLRQLFNSRIATSRSTLKDSAQNHVNTHSLPSGACPDSKRIRVGYWY
jgi:hypothetical protein